MARSKKRRIKFGRIFLLLLLIVLLVVGGIFAYDKVNKKTEPVKKVKEISSIKDYDYTLKENATSYFKKLFKELDNTLNEENVDEEKYMTLVAQMFVADFFNLDNKVSKSDVGGKQFVYKDYQNDFEKYAVDTMYKTVESNVYGNRNQELPIVTNVEVEKVKNEAYKYNDNKDDNAYVVNFKITYEKDLDYQTEGSLIIIHNGKKLEIASMSEKSSS